MRILSIDFDYFVNPTPLQRGRYFPDGGREMSDLLNTTIWSGAYALSAIATKRFANKKDSLLDVELLKEPLKAVHDIIMSQGNICCMVADSHAHAYDFIQNNYDGSVTELYNVDFHHDTYNVDEEVNCGNWLRRLLEEGIVDEAYWVNQPDSGMEDNLAKVIPFSKLPKTEYDLVYVCRSGWWTPPHMDKEFIEQLARPLIENKNGWEVVYQQGILEDRYSEEFNKLVKQETDIRDRIQTELSLQEN